MQKKLTITIDEEVYQGYAISLGSGALAVSSKT